MKKSELRHLIREELNSYVNDNVDVDKVMSILRHNIPEHEEEFINLLSQWKELEYNIDMLLEKIEKTLNSKISKRKGGMTLFEKGHILSTLFKQFEH